MSKSVKEEFEQFVQQHGIHAYQCLPTNPYGALPTWLQGFLERCKKKDAVDGADIRKLLAGARAEVPVGDWVSTTLAEPLSKYVSVYKNQFFFENFIPLWAFGFCNEGIFLPLEKITTAKTSQLAVAHQWDGLSQTQKLPHWMDPLMVFDSDAERLTRKYLIMMADYNGNDASMLRTIQNGMVKDVHHTDWILFDGNSNFIFMSNDEFTSKYTDITPEIFVHAVEQKVVTVQYEFTRIYAPVAVAIKTANLGKAKLRSPVVDFYQWNNEDVSNKTFVPSWVIKLIEEGVIVMASSLDVTNGTAVGPYILKASCSETGPIFYLKDGVYLVSEPSGKLQLFSEKDFHENYDIVK